MMRRLLLVSACVLAGSVAFASKTMAQDARVDFYGDVEPYCAWTGSVSGNLNQVEPNILSGIGSAIFECNTSGSVSVKGITSSRPVAGGNANAFLPKDVLGPGENSIPVVLNVESSQPIAAGSYSYTVTVTATPGQSAAVPEAQ